jgi:hypothetical protein
LAIDFLFGYLILDKVMNRKTATNHPGSPRKKISTP